MSEPPYQGGSGRSLLYSRHSFPARVPPFFEYPEHIELTDWYTGWVCQDNKVRPLKYHIVTFFPYRLNSACTFFTVAIWSKQSAYFPVLSVVLTDVIMPEMNGRMLTENLMVNRPGLK